MYLRIIKNGNCLELTIRDDGRGFDVEKTLLAAAQRESMGLEGMIERVRHSGGEIEIHSKNGKGATIRAQFPILQQDLSQ